MNFHKLGEGYGTISKHLNIARSTVQSIMKKFKVSGTTDTLHAYTWMEAKTHSQIDKENTQ